MKKIDKIGICVGWCECAVLHFGSDMQLLLFLVKSWFTFCYVRASNEIFVLKFCISSIVLPSALT